MSVTLLTGPAAAGKTRAVLSQIRAALADDPLQTIWVLLPSELQIADFRARLAVDNGGPCFGVELLDFYALYHRLLSVQGLPQRRLRDAGRFRVLRHVMDAARDEVQHFAAILDTPGLIAAVAEFIQELKRARITPEAFAAAARTAKDHELARFYAGYQAFLRDRELVDDEGEGWLAAARLGAEDAARLNVGMLFVDGFDQFSIVQVELLRALSRHIPQIFITLNYEPERAATAHRRYAQTRDLLYTHLNLRETTLAAEPTSRAAALEALTAGVFEPNAMAVPPANAVFYIEAPDPRREVEAALWAAKRAIIEGDYSPHEIAILTRDPALYRAYLYEFASAYGVPMRLRQGLPLAENPAVRALLSLLDLAAGRFPRRALLDALRNPYIEWPELDAEAVNLLDQVARLHVVERGREEWSAALRRPTLQRASEDDDAPVLLDPARQQTLATATVILFDRLTPPERATAQEFAAWIDALIGPDPALLPDDFTLEPDADDLPSTSSHFNLIGRIRAAVAYPDFIARDLAALNCLRSVLSDLVAAAGLLGSDAPLTWAQFRADLAIAVENTTVPPTRPASVTGGVLFASVYEARGIEHRLVILLGLAEGQFPAPAREDALYHDSERAAFNRAGLDGLLTRASEADERSLFYEMTALARDGLIFIRPYSDGANPLPPSTFWEAARRVVVGEVERIRMVSISDIPGTLSTLELARSLAAELDSANPAAETWGAAAWLGAAPQWANVQRGRVAELDRIYNRETPYNGVLKNSEARAAVAAALGPERIWSASQFEELGACGFHFFGHQLLALEPEETPEPGLTAQQRGQLCHRILENVYARLEQQGLPIIAEHADRISGMLENAARPIFAAAPFTPGFRPGPLWDQEQAAILKGLRALIASDFSKDSAIGKQLEGPRRARYVEAKFGGEGGLLLEGDAGPLRVRGRIDRIDIVDDQAVIVDYKSGGKLEKSEIARGRSVQLLLYREGARALFRSEGIETEVRGGLFVNLKNGGVFSAVDSARDATLLEGAKALLVANVIEARKGRFTERREYLQDGKCEQFCPFAELCRIAVRE